MGHRAFIAYERPDRTYNIHYSHWGACNLRLKQAITEATPFGSETPSETLQSIHADLCEATSKSAIEQALDGLSCPDAQIDIEPHATQCSLEEIITEQLDFLHHEAFYAVDSAFDVTAYRTHWFGLQYDARTVEEGPTIGNGALRTVRWYDGEPVGDSFAQGEFRALKAVAGDMIDRGVFDQTGALEYLAQKLADWVDDEQKLLIRTPSDLNAVSTHSRGHR